MSVEEARPSLHDPATPWERQLLLWAVPLLLLLAALDGSFFRPGFAAYDEEAQMDLVQAWREGMPLQWRYGYGCLTRAMTVSGFWLLGPNEAWLRLPAMLAVGLEALLLFAWLKPRLGERAALWACLADLVCTATFARTRSMLSPSLLPAVFLAHAVWLDRLGKPWQHALFGLSLMLWTLDYEAWGMGLAWLLPAWLWLHWVQRTEGRAARLAALGLALAAGAWFVWALSPSFKDYAATRAGVSSPEDTVLRQVWQNLAELLGGGKRLAFSGADSHPWPAPWIWPLCLAGAMPLWRRFKGGWALLAVGSAPLALQWTSAEPHRMSLALLGLAAMAGAGAAWAWRWKAARLALPLLLAAGIAHEAWAWTHVDKVPLAYAYGRSQNLRAAARWLRLQAPAEGWDLVDGVGPYNDGNFRMLLDMQRVPYHGGVPVVLVHWDFLPALKGLKGQVVGINESDYLPIYLYLPTAAEVPRLKALQAELAGFQRMQLTAYPEAMRQACLRRLRDRSLVDPWARTVYWEGWMHSSMMLKDVEPKMAFAAAREPLVSGWVFDACARGLIDLPDASKAFSQRSKAADPRRSQLEYPFMRY